MDIRLTTDVKTLSRTERAAKPAAAAKDTETASFDQAAGLDRALAALPEARPEEVDRARSLVSAASYPPEELVERMAKLLALELTENPDTLP